MIRFTTKFRHILGNPPVETMFADAYGKRWASYTAQEWAAVYEAHEKKVDAVFQRTPDRLLKLDIVEGAAKGQHAKLWKSLCTFLGEDQSIPKPGTPLPSQGRLRSISVDPSPMAADKLAQALWAHALHSLPPYLLRSTRD